MNSSHFTTRESSKYNDCAASNLWRTDEMTLTEAILLRHSISAVFESFQLPEVSIVLFCGIITNNAPDMGKLLRRQHVACGHGQSVPCHPCHHWVLLDVFLPPF